MTHHDLNVPYVRGEIKRLSQRYADRMEEYPNILAINSINCQMFSFTDCYAK